MRRSAITLIGIVALTACSRVEDSASVQTNQENRTEKIEVAMPSGNEIVDEQHGRELWFAIAPMSGVDGEPANGVTQAHYFEDGTYLHNLKVNIARNEDGFFYEGWVANSDDPAAWVSLGHLQSYFGDVRHAVQFRGEQDLREYLQVKVTRERDDGNPLPGLVVAEGTLKVTERP